MLVTDSHIEKVQHNEYLSNILKVSPTSLRHQHYRNQFQAETFSSKSISTLAGKRSGSFFHFRLVIIFFIL